jgi:hypothetical protein
MTLAPDRNHALRTTLPNTFHASPPALVIVAALDGQDARVVFPELLATLCLYLFLMFMSNVRISL